MRILLTGTNGQVGWELARTLAPLGEITGCDRAQLDLRNPDQIVSVVRAVRPDAIVNAAAYTAVDRAESERELAFAVNATAPGILAEEAKRAGSILIHYSTDYVFDGAKPGAYLESDATHPINVYGESKLAGERAIGQVAGRHVVLRTSWVYADRGHNFLLTISRLAREKPELSVVADQIGAPTSAAIIAEGSATLIAAAMAGGPLGLYHLSCAGETSWHGFAEAIVHTLGLRTKIRAISSSEYPSAAARPKNSLLNNGKLQGDYGIALPDWRDGLAVCLRTSALSGQR